jgi:hypothetical protein
VFDHRIFFYFLFFATFQKGINSILMRHSINKIDCIVSFKNNDDRSVSAITHLYANECNPQG